jgi:hypothetical protein
MLQYFKMNNLSYKNPTGNMVLPRSSSAAPAASQFTVLPNMAFVPVPIQYYK